MWLVLLKRSTAGALLDAGLRSAVRNNARCIFACLMRVPMSVAIFILKDG